MGNVQNKLKKLNNNCIAYDNPYGFNLCNQPYALCTSAKCIASDNPNIVTCNCPIEIGCSMGTVDCSTLEPFTSNSVDYIYSTFNPSQYFEKNMNSYKYPNNINYASCLNQICTIDPSDPTNAICQCPLVNDNAPWLALGTNYNTDPNIYLSGTEYNTYKSARKFFKPFGIRLPIP
jgi:hypothetical protein